MTPSPPHWLRASGPIGIPELCDRDAACMVLADLDYHAQLAAIRHALRRQRQADEELQPQVADVRTRIARLVRER